MNSLLPQHWRYWLKFTKDVYVSGAKAKARLSLSRTPAIRAEFEILNNP